MCVCVQFWLDWPIFQMRALRLMGKITFVPLACRAKEEEGEEGNMI